jgi:hypothetical protein
MLNPAEVLNTLRKGGNQMAEALKRKLRGFPSGNLSLRIGS